MTVLELLVAATLVAVVGLVVAQAFAAGFRVWERVREMEGGKAEALLALESLQQDVRNTVRRREVLFTGKPGSFEAPALLPPDEPGGEQLAIVRYVFDAARQSLLRTVEASGGKRAERTEILATGVLAGSFAYADLDGTGGAPAWSAEWRGQTNGPAAVKVHWLGKQGEGTFEIERVIWLPCR